MKAKNMNKKCPVLQAALETRTKANDLTRSMRKLRARLVYCQECQPGGCEELQRFNEQIHEAIVEITDEWELKKIVERGTLNV